MGPLITYEIRILWTIFQQNSALTDQAITTQGCSFLDLGDILDLGIRYHIKEIGRKIRVQYFFKTLHTFYKG